MRTLWTLGLAEHLQQSGVDEVQVLLFKSSCHCDIETSTGIVIVFMYTVNYRSFFLQIAVQVRCGIAVGTIPTGTAGSTVDKEDC